MSLPPAYLAPYLAATLRHQGGFGSLLWASRWTQHLRFKAFADAVDVSGRALLDVGCGRGDLYDFLLQRGQIPSRYVGIEAIPTLAEIARTQTGQTIVQNDFILEPLSLDVGADVIFFSGSLNTMNNEVFQATLRRAVEAARASVVFNFLDGPHLAAANHLFFRAANDVLAFCATLEHARARRLIRDYLPGDATIVLGKA